MAWIEEKYANLRNEGSQVTALRQDWSWTSGHAMTSQILQLINTLRKAGKLWLLPLISKPGTVY